MIRMRARACPGLEARRQLPGNLTGVQKSLKLCTPPNDDFLTQAYELSARTTSWLSNARPSRRPAVSPPSPTQSTGREGRDGGPRGRLLAPQGPQASSHLQSLTLFDLSGLTFGHCRWVPNEGYILHVARGGYTGEDSFKISLSVPPAATVAVAQLLAKVLVQITGLGARDSLRLEVGMCLYGQDLYENTGPAGMGLAWAIGKERRKSTTFFGGEHVAQQLQPHAPPRRRVASSWRGRLRGWVRRF